NLAHGNLIAVEASSDRNFDVSAFGEPFDELFGLVISRFVEVDNFLVVCQHAIAAARTLRHLQAAFAVFDAEVGPLAFLAGAGDVHQVSLDRGICGKSTDRNHSKKHDGKSLHRSPSNQSNIES